MKVEYCVGLCPLCRGNGLLRAARDEKNFFVYCDECYGEFNNPRDAQNNNRLSTMRVNSVDLSLQEALAQGWKEYIYVLENGKWINYIAKSKELLAENPKVKQHCEK